MVNKCSVVGCYTNFEGHGKGAVFGLPKDEDLKCRWIRFLNRQDFASSSYVFICEKHFEEKYLNRCKEKRSRLKNKLKPIPSIYPECHNMRPSLQSPVSLPRKPPTLRPILLDQTKSFKKHDINDFKDINNSLLRHLEDGYGVIHKVRTHKLRCFLTPPPPPPCTLFE